MNFLFILLFLLGIAMAIASLTGYIRVSVWVGAVIAAVGLVGYFLFRLATNLSDPTGSNSSQSQSSWLWSLVTQGPIPYLSPTNLVPGVVNGAVNFIKGIF